MPRAKKEITKTTKVPVKKGNDGGVVGNTIDNQREEMVIEVGGGVEKKSNTKSDPKVMKEYFRLQRQYFLSHAPRIFVLMQIGAFYEIYAFIENKIDGKEIYNEESYFSEFLELTEYKKMEKGQWVDGKEVMGAGFRDYQLEEQLDFLTKSGYTVVVYSQKPTKKNGVQERELHGIFSPGTYVSGIEGEIGMGLGGKVTGRTTNHVMCIWLETFSKGKKMETSQRMVIGVSVMNMFSGESFVLEYEKTIELRWVKGVVEYIYQPSLFDELERYVYTYQPNETLVIGSKESIEAVLDYTGLKTSCQMNHLIVDENVGPGVVVAVAGEGSDEKGGVITKQEKINRCKKQKYIESILGSVFGDKSVSQCSEWDYYVLATRSFCYLLDFIAEHRPELIRKVSPPLFHNTTDRVLLANHTLQQLNILEVEDAKGLWEHGVSSTHGGKGGNLRSVVGFLNRTLTPMGKRRIQECLVSPTFSETKLEREYDMIQSLLDEEVRCYGDVGRGSGIIDEIRESLRGVRDIERISRQLLLHRLCPGVLYTLYISLEKIFKLETHLNEKMPKQWREKVEELCDGFGGGVGGGGGSRKKLGGEMAKKLFKYISFCGVNIEACKGVNSINTLGEEAVIWNEEIEQMSEQITEKERLFTMVMDKCNAFLGQDWIHLKKTEKGQWSLETTKIRGRLFQSKIDELVDLVEVKEVGNREKKSTPNNVNIDVKWFTNLRIVKQGSSDTTVAISNTELSEASKERMDLLEKRKEQMVKLYQQFLVDFCDKWYDVLFTYGKYAGVIDTIQCKAYLAREYHYCRPTLIKSLLPHSTASDSTGENTSLSSSSRSPSENVSEEEEEEGKQGGIIRATGLRHVLIEHLQQQEIYVANDVRLGEDAEEGRGWLVYGTNAVGKTSLIRAVGITVIMAQAGFYVPCSSFEYRPYQAIYTRILGNDNLFKGMSSFDVEMSELRVILREADARSLILGDELCSGTEMESALSIFVASLEHLVSVESSFLFATHFHEIVYYSEVEKMQKEGGLALKHLTVHYDAETGKLVYDRRLKSGAGSALYGLEVCKSLYLPVTFIDRAYEIRKKYGGYVEGRKRNTMMMGGGGGEEGSGMIRLEDDASSYHSKKMRGVCERCHREMGEEVHHIIPQKKANARGMIVGEKGEVFHKNHKANLMTLCHSCHLLEHGGNFRG